MAKHTICNTSRLWGTQNNAGLVNIKILSDMDNGAICALNGPADGEVEAFAITTPAEGAELHTLCLLVEPEVMYDERLKLLSDFYNIAGEDGRVCRAYMLQHGDEFALSAEGFEGEPVVGQAIGCNGTFKFAVGGTGFGKIVGILNDLFVIRVD